MKTINSLAQIALFMAVVLFFQTGCVTTSESGKLNYQAIEQTKPIMGAEKVKFSIRMRDKRPSKFEIAAKKNALNMAMARIMIEEDASKTVKSAIEKEFERVGFVKTSGAVVVEVELKTFYADFKQGFLTWRAEASVDMIVRVIDASGKTLVEKSIEGKHTKPKCAICSAPSALEALEGALAKAVSRVSSNEAVINALFSASSVRR